MLVSLKPFSSKKLVIEFYTNHFNDWNLLWQQYNLISSLTSTQKFVKDAEKQYKDLLDSYDKMKSEFKATAEFFSEMQITTEDFFGAFAIFLQQFEVRSITYVVYYTVI